MPAPFTKTVRGVAVPTIGLGVFEIEPEETGRIDELSERRHRNVDPGFAPDWGD